MEDLTAKQAFGVALALYPDDAFKAAVTVFEEDSGAALRASQQWVKDPVVLASKAAYIEQNGKPSGLPNKTEFAKEILDMARQKDDAGSKFIYDAGHRLAAYRLAGELMGFLAKGDTNVNVLNDNRTQNVMVVKEFQDDAAWEKRALEQQAALTHVAAN